MTENNQGRRGRPRDDRRPAAQRLRSFRTLRRRPGKDAGGGVNDGQMREDPEDQGDGEDDGGGCFEEEEPAPGFAAGDSV